jgi:hypothetical protein
MTKDLATSRIDRQNILNNSLALAEIQDKTGLKGIIWDGKLMLTKNMVAAFFEVDIRTISRLIRQNNEELTENGYKVLRGKELKSFIKAMVATDGRDINVPTKTSVLGVFDFKAFLNLAMLLTKSDKARILRQMMLDIVIDLINQRTGGSTKYINRRDRDFVYAFLQENNYRRQFATALNDYVVAKQNKFAHFTDMIYVSIFKEKADEYKKILDLSVSENERDTFYSEILDIIAAYESGLADELKSSYEKKGGKLTVVEAEKIFDNFASHALWQPLLNSGRIKMASRDLALRDAFHYRLSEYIQPLGQDEYEKFLGIAGEELENLMNENSSLLKRLKERK